MKINGKHAIDSYNLQKRATSARDIQNDRRSLDSRSENKSDDSRDEEKKESFESILRQAARSLRSH